ncbi:hypothetical protein L6452_01412 [Arctium lappa]|uniref:Uncharacterized protein n=1 Tax=Arctium lappa TaxID=4217 RepID=A0ACB9FHF0_ARCLA|nr:hypothetical protein L6452_01412 [Arctium lappa]
MDESKKLDRKNSVGLLKEIYQMEKSVRSITDLIDSAHQFPLTEEEMEKVKAGVGELSVVSNAYENGYDLDVHMETRREERKFQK